MNSEGEIEPEEWCPVAFFSWFEIKHKLELHQLWVSSRGNTKWKQIEERIIKDKQYAECASYSETETDIE
jgi:hypothetical protein